MSYDIISNKACSMLDNDELEKIASRLSDNMNNKFFFNTEPYKVHNSVKIFEQYSGKNLRQSYFQNCVFEKANLEKTGLAGSIFLDCTFTPNNFTDTNLQSCDFRNCSFFDVEFKYTRMNKSSFYRTVFSNCEFLSVSLNDAIFEDCKFINCKWTISIENTIFKNTSFDNVRFKSMNFEFATFENIKTNNVKLPFPTIPFIYNGLSYLQTTNDNVKVTSAQKKEGLTKEEYLSYLSDLEKFYIYTQNYFPLTNIYIAKNDFTNAFNAIVYGIKIAIGTRSFRMIKYYCKQTKYIRNITMHQRQNLYFFILNELSKCELEDYELVTLNLYLPEVKELLYTESQNERIQIVIDTNIEQTEYNKVSCLMSVLDKYLNDKCTYSIELRHNSPFQFIYDILTNPDNVGLIIGGISFIADVTFNCINLAKSKKKELSNSEKSKCSNHKEELNSNNIVINNIYIINNGNIFVNNQNSFNGDIYLNK